MRFPVRQESVSLPHLRSEATWENGVEHSGSLSVSEMHRHLGGSRDYWPWRGASQPGSIGASASRHKARQAKLAEGTVRWPVRRLDREEAMRIEIPPWLVAGAADYGGLDFPLRRLTAIRDGHSWRRDTPASPTTEDPISRRSGVVCASSSVQPAVGRAMSCGAAARLCSVCRPMARVWSGLLETSRQGARKNTPTSSHRRTQA